MLGNLRRVALLLCAALVWHAGLRAAPPESPRPRGERLRAIAERLRENAQPRAAQAETPPAQAEPPAAEEPATPAEEPATPAEEPATPAEPAAPAEPARASGIDFAALNGVLAEALQGFAEIEPTFEQLAVQFDAASTNWEADQLALQAQATLVRTAWSESPTSLSLSLLADIDPAAAGRPAQGLVRLEFSLQTDVVPLLAHAQQRLAQPPAPRLRLRPFRPEPAAQHPSGPLAELRAAAAAAGPLDSLDAAADLLLAHSGRQLSSASGSIDELKAKLTSATDPAEQQRLAEELAAARVSRDKLLALRLSIDRNPQGAAERMTIERAPSPTGDEPVQLSGLALQITPEAIQGRVELQVQRGVEGYLLFKPLLTGLLQNLQRDDPAAKAQLLSLLGLYWAQLRGDIVAPAAAAAVPEGESPAAEPPPAGSDAAPLDDPFNE